MVRNFGHIRKRQRKSGIRYEASFPNPSNPIKRITKTFKSRSLANRWLRQQQAMIELDQWEAPETKQSLHVETVRSLYDDWIAAVKITDAESTVYTYISRSKRFLAYFGDLPLEQLDRERVEDFIKRMYSDANIKPGAAYNAVDGLRLMLMWATRYGRIDANICARVVWPKYKPVRDKTDEERYATIPQIQALADAMPERLRLAVYLASYGSMRLGEIRGLQRKDIEFSDQGVIIHVRRQVASKAGNKYTAPKTKAGVRDFYFPQIFADDIQHHLKMFVANVPDAPLFTAYKNPAQPIGDNTFRNAWNQARERAGMDGFLFHDLRGTGITMLLHHGATHGEVMTLVGHSDRDSIEPYERFLSERYAMITDSINNSIMQELNPSDNVVEFRAQ